MNAGKSRDILIRDQALRRNCVGPCGIFFLAKTSDETGDIPAAPDEVQRAAVARIMEPPLFLGIGAKDISKGPVRTRSKYRHWELRILAAGGDQRPIRGNAAKDRRSR